MPRTFIHAALLFCAVSAAAHAEAAGSNKSSSGSSNEMICRYEQETGSHIKKRSCATRAAREQQARRDQDNLNRIQQRPTGSSSGPSRN